MGGPPSTAFPSFKGINWAWGVRASDGVSIWREWLYDSYDEATWSRQFDYMRNLGCRWVRVHMWLDGMINKDGDWGTSNYVPSWNAAYQAQWESFLQNVCIAKGMQIVPSLLFPTISPNAYLATRDMETEVGGDSDSFLPTNTGAALVSATLANGNIDTGVGTLPDGFAMTLGNTTGVTWQNVSAGTPPIVGAGGKEIQVVNSSGSDKAIGTTLVTIDPLAPLGQWQVGVKGQQIRIDVAYYTAANVYVTQAIAKNYTDYADWTLVSFGNIDDPDLRTLYPTATKMRLICAFKTGYTSYMEGARFNYGAHNPKWQNYVDVVDAWCSLYGKSSRLSPAILAWNPMNEQYSGLGWWKQHPFLRACYQAISGPSEIPVMVDWTNLGLPATSAWMPIFDDCSDIISFHTYITNGILTNNTDSPLTKMRAALAHRKWCLNEAGPPLPILGWTNEMYARVMHNFLASVKSIGGLGVAFWSLTNSNQLLMGPSGGQLVYPYSVTPVGRYFRAWDSPNYSPQLQNPLAVRPEAAPPDFRVAS